MSPIESTDLVCNARRRALGAAEQRQLERLLVTSFEVRLIDAVLEELDRESRVQRSDDALIARLAARAVSHRARGTGFWSPRLLRSSLAALGILSLATVAAGAYFYRSSIVPTRKSLEMATPPPAAVSRAAVRAPARTGSPIGATPLASVLPVTVATTSQPPKARAPAEVSNPVRSASPRAESNDAALLFARANQARREGRPDEARQLYASILGYHPQAREAALARLAFAKLTESEDPDRALREYAVLAKARGTLSTEALWGTAQLARRIGRASLERQALTELRDSYPSSPYARIARERLEHEEP